LRRHRSTRSLKAIFDQWLVETLGEWLSENRIRSELDSLQTVALTRFQQLSVPLCAKAVEDTAFYVRTKLLKWIGIFTPY
jgi:maltooligosyltrehalose synthase